MKGRAAVTSAALSLLFVAVYGTTNWITTHRSDVGTWVFEWERYIPFVPWMIIPYLSIDLFFVAAPFLCRNRQELRTFATRITFAIVVGGACFLLFPLQLAVERPEATGWIGVVFKAFVAMDAPHNLLPSLHIALRALLVPIYHQRTRGVARVAIHVWFSLIGVSTLLTHQHHVIDIAGGFLLALVTVHLFPVRAFALASRNVRVAGYYVLVALALTSAAALSIAAAVAAPWGLLASWPIAALLVVALAYLGFGGRVYRKANGKIPLATRLFLAPVLLGQELSRRHYRRRCSAWSEVTPDVWIGAQLDAEETQRARNEGVVAVVDLTAEFTEAKPFRNLQAQGGAYLNLPVLDLTAPTQEQLREATDFIERHAERGVVYVHCKIGYSRSVAVVVAYLLATDQVADVSEGIARVRRARRSIVVRPEIVRVLEDFASRGTIERRSVDRRPCPDTKNPVLV